jgi:hypothetical protein
MRASASSVVICFAVLAAAHLLAPAAGFFPAVPCRRPREMGGRGTGCELGKKDVALGSLYRGTVGELHQKHLLALNIRSLPEALTLAPRAYLLSRETALAFGGAAAAAAACALGRTPEGVCCDVAAEKEMQNFQIDYLVSMAASILRAGTYSPAPAKTERGRPSRADVELAVAVCRAYLTPTTRSRVLMLSAADRVRLCQGAYMPHHTPPKRALLNATAAAAAAAAAEAEVDDADGCSGGGGGEAGRGSEVADVLAQLQRLPDLQLDLLVSNVWIVKPATSAMGRGITFLPQGGGGGGGGAGGGGGGGKLEKAGGDGQGYIVQKYIERPHLLSPQGLARARTALSNDDAPGFACLHDGDTCPNGVGAGGDAAAARSARHLLHTHAGAEGGADTGRGGAAGGDRAKTAHCTHFKYNVRFWLEVAWSSVHPEAWLYEDGYIELADAPFEAGDFSEPCAHVTNLSRQPGRGGAGAQGVTRLWTSDEYRECLSASCVEGEQALARDLVARVALHASRVLASISMQPSPGAPVCSPAALASSASTSAGAGKNNPVYKGMAKAEDARSVGCGGGAEGEDAIKDKQEQQGPSEDAVEKVKWKRFGVDFAVDEACGVWLIEFNVNPGMRAPRSRRGDAKRVLVQRFLRHERLLKDWRHAVSGAGDGDGGRDREREVISGAEDWMEDDEDARPIGRRGGLGGGAEGQAFGFRRLDVPGWPPF